jgi:hypothetical protein
MWQSGYVVVPSSAGCCISVTLQVDPKVRQVGPESTTLLLSPTTSLRERVVCQQCACSSEHLQYVESCSVCKALCCAVLVPQGWIPTSVINWSLEAIPLNIQRVRDAVRRLAPAGVLDALPDCNRQQGEECRKAPPLEALGRLPPGWESRRYCPAARVGGVGGVVGVQQQQQQGWGGRGSRSYSLGGSSACSYGSSSSLREEGAAVEGVEWYDAVE